MVGDSKNIMKTTFDFNFDLYQVFKQDVYTKTWTQWEAVDYNSFSLINSNFYFEKNVHNLNANKKSSSLYW